jgi:lysozyme family protein
MADFAPAIKILLQNEGGYVNNPADPGGETNYGICKRSYPNEDIRNLTVERAKEIYRLDFWTPLRCGQINDQCIATNLFDFGVNAGTGTARHMMADCLGVQGYQHAMWPDVVGLINKSNGGDLNFIFTYRRIEYYFSLASNRSSLRQFFKGWINRSLKFI